MTVPVESSRLSLIDVRHEQAAAAVEGRKEPQLEGSQSFSGVGAKLVTKAPVESYFSRRFPPSASPTYKLPLESITTDSLSPSGSWALALIVWMTL
jgi:hypothetical protein